MTSPRAILGIDSATTSGVALLLPGGAAGGLALYRLAAYGAVRRTTPTTVASVLDRVAELACDRPVAAYVEEPYLARGPAANPRTLASLVTHRTYWSVACEARGWPVELVRASKWQSNLLGCRRGAPRAERKRAAQAHVLAVEGMQTTQDEADAICLAYWALRRECVATGCWCRLDAASGWPVERVRWR